MKALSQEQIVARGREAKGLLEHPLLRETMRTYEDQIVLRWSEAKTVADRESAHAEMRALKGLLRTLRAIMDRGAVSEIVAKRADGPNKP